MTVDGKNYTETFEVKMDPRVTTTAEGLRKQFALSWDMYNIVNQSYQEMARADRLQEHLKGMAADATGSVKEHLETTRRDLEALTPKLRVAGAHALQVYQILQGSDNAPTSQAEAAAKELELIGQSLFDQWNTLTAGLPVDAGTVAQKDKLTTADKDGDADADEP